MRSSGWAPIAGWCAATATSIVLASVAILPVLRTDSPTDTALSSIDQMPAAQTSFPAPLPTADSPSASTKPDPSPTTRKPKPTKTSSSPTPAAKPTPTPTKAVTTAPPATTTEDGWTVTTEDDGTRTYVRSFQVEGGQAVIKMTSDGVVSLVTATPADGYAVQKTQDSPGNMAVYFTETNHSFIIHAVWYTDRPFTEVSEVGQ